MNNEELNKYIFFCSHNKDHYKEDKNRAIFSQWWEQDMVASHLIYDLSHLIDPEDYNKYIKDKIFISCEHWMMTWKLLIFAKGASRIQNLNFVNQMNEEIAQYRLGRNGQSLGTLQSHIKAFGRKTVGFEPAVWDQHKYKVVVNGNYMKFGFTSLLGVLRDTGDKILVEASSYDRVWGIGYNAKDAPNNKENWGENLLGKALMEVREKVFIFQAD